MANNYVMIKKHDPGEMGFAVVDYLDNGFELHGSPYGDHHGFIYQAVVKLEPTNRVFAESVAQAHHNAVSYEGSLQDKLFTDLAEAAQVVLDSVGFGDPGRSYGADVQVNTDRLEALEKALFPGGRDG